MGLIMKPTVNASGLPWRNSTYVIEMTQVDKFNRVIGTNTFVRSFKNSYETIRSKYARALKVAGKPTLN